MCVAANSNNAIERVESYVRYIWTSSNSSDSRCNPYNVVDPNGYGWWAPAYDVGHAKFEMHFVHNYTV